MTNTLRITVFAAVAFLGPVLAVTTWHWDRVYDYLDVQPNEVTGQVLYFMAPT